MSRWLAHWGLGEAPFTKEISDSTLGMPAPMSTTNGARFTPRLLNCLLCGRRRRDIAFCTISARSRDSSSLSFSAIALMMSGSWCIPPADVAFSRAATASASGFDAKFR